MKIEELKELLLNKDGNHFSRRSGALSIPNEKIEFSSYIFNQYDFSGHLRLLTFINCEFIGNELLFEEITKKHLAIYFRNCTINCNLYFTNQTSLKSLKFIDTLKIPNVINIIGCEFDEFYLLNSNDRNNQSLIGNIDISGNTFNKKIDFSNLIHSSGYFKFDDNILLTKESDNNENINATFEKSYLNNADFSNTNFGDEVKFDKVKLSYDKCTNNFMSCVFNKAYFNGSDFGKYALFNGSYFNNILILVECENLKNTHADFSGCKFKNKVFFDYSKFDNLIIKNAHFDDSTSFENTKFNLITIEKNVFERPVFFDDIELIKIKDINRKTLRNIKIELQKTENRIDYNKFKAYELNAYRREIKTNKKHKFDRWVLYFNQISTNHGLDWSKGVLFTLLFGILFYTLYFISEHYYLDFSFKYESVNKFVLGYFNYLIPSYKSPFGENFLNHWPQIIIFIFGKVFISYGIYQTIQAFRKFRL